jgi:hypothetical protein
MKKIIIPFLMLLIVYANEISEHKTFTKNIKSSLLSTTLKIHIQNKNIATLTNEINNILNIMDNYKFCKNKTYSILPKYKNQKFINYYTDLNFKCEFQKDKLPIFSKLLNKLNKHIISIYNFQYTLTKDLYQKAQNNLKIEAFNYGLEKAKKLSNTFNKKCFMKSINFNNTHQVYTRNVVMFKQSTLPTPKNNTQNILLNVNYLFVCFK